MARTKVVSRARKPSRTSRGLTKKPHARHTAGQWKETFLRALRLDPNVSAAARTARVNRQYVYAARALNEADGKPKVGAARLDAQTFAAAWDDALAEALDELEAEARRRAHEGLVRKKFTRSGAPIMDPATGAQYIEREYSDALMMFLLRAHRYGERHAVEVTGKNGGPVEIEDMEALRAKRWQQVAPALAAVLAQPAITRDE